LQKLNQAEKLRYVIFEVVFCVLDTPTDFVWADLKSQIKSCLLPHFLLYYDFLKNFFITKIAETTIFVLLDHFWSLFWWI